MAVRVEATAARWAARSAPLMTILCLEAHYRYTPLYGLGYEPNPEKPVADTHRPVAAAADAAVPPREIPRTSSARPPTTRAPVVTDHGDFLYTAHRTREGGFGGSDIYRARISGAAPSALENLGEEVNSESDETDPALRMEGFHLVFNTDRDGAESAGLYTAKSRRLVKRYNYFKLPSFGWIGRNLHWLLILAISVAGCVWLTRRALAASKHKPREANV